MVFLLGVLVGFLICLAIVIGVVVWSLEVEDNEFRLAEGERW